MIVKAAASEADAVCIDLEDSVPADREGGEPRERRARVRRARFRATRADVPHQRASTRRSPIATSIDVVEAVGDRIDLVMLPKAGSPADVAVRRDAADADRSASRLRATRSASRRRSRPRPASCGCARSRRLAATRGADLRRGRLRGVDAHAGVRHRNVRRERRAVSGTSLARGDARDRRRGARERPALHRRAVLRLRRPRRLRARVPDRARDGLRRQAVHSSDAAGDGERRFSRPTPRSRMRGAWSRRTTPAWPAGAAPCRSTAR